MATKLEDLVIRLRADTAQLERELRQSGAAVSNFTSKAESGFASLKRSAVGIGAAVGVAFAANKLREFASAALELGGSLNDTAQRLGVTAEALQVYRAQAHEAGVDSGAVDSSLQSFSKTLGQLQSGIGRATKQLTALDPALLANLQTAKSTDEAYRLVADAVRAAAEAGDQQRAAAIASATGMSSLLGVLKEGAEAFDTFGARARESGLILSNEAVRSLDAFGEALDRVKQSSLVGFAEGLAGIEAGAGDMSAVLTDPEFLRGISDLAAALGSLAGFGLSVAEAFNTAVRATRELLGILPHVQGAIPPGGLSVWERNKATMPGVLPPDVGMSSRGDPFFFGDSALSTPRDAVGPAIMPRARSGGGGGGGRSRSRGNAAPRLDPSITQWKMFEEEAKALGVTIKSMDKDFDAFEKAASQAADEGIEHFQEMERSAEAFGSFVGNIFGNLLRDGKIDFKGIALSFAETIVEMEAKAAASALFKAAGGSVDGKGGSILGGLFSSIGKIFGFAEGGHFTRPTLAVVGDGQDSEWALPDSKLRGLLAASGGRTVVNVNNYGSDQVTTKTRRSGGTEIIDVTVARSIRRQLGAGAMKDEFGRRHAPGVS